MAGELVQEPVAAIMHGQERVGEQARGALSSGTLLHLVISCCLGASVMTELVVELLRAEIFVLSTSRRDVLAGQASSGRSRPANRPEFLRTLATRAQPAASVLVCVVRVSSSLS